MSRWIFRLIARQSFVRGSSLFTKLTAVIAAVRLIQKFTGTGPKTLYIHELEPGQALLVTDARSQK